MKSHFLKTAVIALTILFSISSCSDEEENSQGSVTFNTTIRYSSSDPYVAEAGILVRLYNDANTLLQEKVTPANGVVKMTGLNAGNYEWYTGFDADNDGSIDGLTPYSYGTFTLNTGEDKIVTAQLN